MTSCDNEQRCVQTCALQVDAYVTRSIVVVITEEIISCPYSYCMIFIQLANAWA